MLTDPLALATGYVYDDLGRLTRTSSPASGLTSYTYDEDGRITARTDASGRSVSYTYDLLGRLAGITYPSSGEDVVLAYDQGTNGVGRLTGLTFRFVCL
jgi:YD repeat-containing protein